MYNFKICERILKIIVGSFAMFIYSNFNEIKVFINDLKKIMEFFITNANDGLYIPIFAPTIGGDAYYCQKSFHSTLFQEIVLKMCVLKLSI
jgi:hypothetical protein